MPCVVTFYRRALVVALAAALGSGTALAQASQTRLTGKITDKESGQPIPFAQIQIVGTNVVTQTNQQGIYLVRGLAAGGHTLRALALVAARSRRHRGLAGVFQFWLFNWTNAMLKYEGLTDADFDIESVPEGFDRSLILPEHYTDEAGEDIPQAKIAAQQRATVGQLRRLTVLQ
jgi:hypothetical protein